MRLEKLQNYLKERSMKYEYYEDMGCGSIEFIHRGLAYHIWEYPDGEGADSNVKTVGRMDAYTEDYEEQILAVLRTW
jgi:hypothetical protein